MNRKSTAPIPERSHNYSGSWSSFVAARPAEQPRLVNFTHAPRQLTRGGRRPPNGQTQASDSQQKPCTPYS